MSQGHAKLAPSAHDTLGAIEDSLDAALSKNDGIEIRSILALNDVGKNQGHFLLVISEARVLPLDIIAPPGA